MAYVKARGLGRETYKSEEPGQQCLYPNSYSPAFFDALSVYRREHRVSDAGRPSAGDRGDGLGEPGYFAAQLLAVLPASVIPRNAARDDDGAPSPKRITAFSMMVTMPGIGVVAMLNQNTPRTIHTPQKSSALM